MAGGDHHEHGGGAVGLDQCRGHEGGGDGPNGEEEHEGGGKLHPFMGLGEVMGVGGADRVDGKGGHAKEEGGHQDAECVKIFGHGGCN